MQLILERQVNDVTDETRAKLAMSLSILKGILLALKGERVDRLGGFEKITLTDLAREYREGDRDCGICFEYAIHDAITGRDKLVWPIVSEVLNDHCGIKNGANSILFGAEKTAGLSLIKTNRDLINSDSRILAGNIGQPAKLEKNWDKISKAMRSAQAREKLPESIKGLWKADLFLGNSQENRWVGSTLKINPDQLEGAAGLRIGVFPERTRGERPSIDTGKNLVLLPLPYNASFMEYFYESFILIKTFIGADAKLPKPVALPDSDDRFIAEEFEKRRLFPVLDVIDAMKPLGQVNLLSTAVEESEGSNSMIAPIAAQSS